MAEEEKKARGMQIGETKLFSRNVTETGGRFIPNEKNKVNRTEIELYICRSRLDDFILSEQVRMESYIYRFNRFYQYLIMQMRGNYLSSFPKLNEIRGQFVQMTGTSLAERKSCVISERRRSTHTRTSNVGYSLLYHHTTHVWRK